MGFPKRKTRKSTSKRTINVDANKLITYHKPKSPVSEIYRTIRTNIQFSSFDKEIKTLTVTSSMEGEGKSTTLANLAVTLAQQGNRILMVDADLRRPKLHRIFDVLNNQGLTELLVKNLDPDDLIQKTFVEGISVLPTGQIPPNPAELLGSRRMRHFIERVKAEYDYVLVDIPPVCVVTDGLLIANQLDGVVLLCSSGHVTIDQAKRGKELLVNAKANILGVVLNNVSSDKAETYYYYQPNQT